MLDFDTDSRHWEVVPIEEAIRDERAVVWKDFEDYHYAFLDYILEKETEALSAFVEDYMKTVEYWETDGEEYYVIPGTVEFLGKLSLEELERKYIPTKEIKKWREFLKRKIKEWEGF